MQTTLIITIDSEDRNKLLALGEIALEGNYEVREIPKNREEINIVESETEYIPTLLCNGLGEALRPLTTQEIKQITQEGVTKEITIFHPRADVYGLPAHAGNCPPLWKALIGDLGYASSKKVILETKDTRDDSPERYILNVCIPPELFKGMEEKTQQIVQELETDLEGVQNLTQNLDWNVTLGERKKILEDHLLIFNSQGGRGVGIADEIDNLRAEISLLENSL